MIKNIKGVLLFLGIVCAIFPVQTMGEVTPIQHGKAYLFDGVDDLVDTGSDIIGTKAVTITGWINPSSFGEYGHGRILDNGSFVIGLFTNYELYVVSDFSTIVKSLTNSIELNKLQFIAVTREADGTVNFYIGDKTTAPALSGSADQDSGTPAAGTTNVIIGNNAAATRTFDGKIGNLQIHEKILTPEEIALLWAGKPVPDGNLIHSWHCDEGDGAISYDSVKEWFGEDLVTNGGFDTEEDWNTNNGWVIDNGIINYGNISNVFFGQPLNIIEGRRYRLKFDVLNLEAGSALLAFTNQSVSSLFGIGYQGYNLGENTVEFEALSSSTAIRIYANNGSGSEFGLDNISIEKLHSPSHGTITNADLETFHATDNNFKSYQNELGFSEEVQETQETLQTSDLINQSYTTFVGDGVSGFSVTSDGTATHRAGTTEEIPLVIGDKILVEFNFLQNSGALPTIGFAPTITTGLISDNINPVTGKVSHLFTITATNVASVLKFYNISGVTDYEVSNLTIFKISPDGVKIPIALTEDGKTTKLDIFGNTPTYLDQVKYNTKLVGNSVAVFDGVDDRVNLGEVSELIGIDNFIIESTCSYDGLGVFFSKGINVSNFMGVYVTGDLFYVDTRVTGSGYGTTPLTNIPTGLFDLKIIYDGTGATNADKLKLYFNGVEQTLSFNSTIVSSLAGLTTDDFLIGDYDGGLSGWNGKISSFKISTDGKAICSYNFSEGAGTTIFDRVPTAINQDVSTDYVARDGLLTDEGDFHRIEFLNPTVHFFKKMNLVAGKDYTLSCELRSLPGSLPNATWGARETAGGVGIGDAIALSAGSDFDDDGEWHAFTSVFNVTKTGDFGFNLYDGGNLTAGQYFDIRNLTVDFVSEPINGTIANADLSTFWGTDDKANTTNLSDGFTNGLYCETAGTSYTPSEQAYGTWEFDLRKKSSDLKVSFLSQDNADLIAGSNYHFRVSDVGSNLLEFQKRTSGGYTELFKTQVSYIDNNTDYKIKVERNSFVDEFHTGAIGSFAVYIKGGDFGDEYVLVEADSGTNPIVDNTYTTSKYFVADLDAGDQISGLTMREYTIDMHAFEEGTGTYGNLYIPSRVDEGVDVFGNVLTVLGSRTPMSYSTASLALIAGQRWARLGVNYFNTETKKLFIGTLGGLLETYIPPETEQFKSSSEITTIDTNQTAVEGLNYWDKELQKFFRGLANGTLIDFLTWYNA